MGSIVQRMRNRTNNKNVPPLKNANSPPNAVTTPAVYSNAFSIPIIQPQGSTYGYNLQSGYGLSQEAFGQNRSLGVLPNNQPVTLTRGWPGITCPAKISDTDSGRISALTGLDKQFIETLSNEFSLITHGTGELDKAKFQNLMFTLVYGPEIKQLSTITSNFFRSYDSDLTSKLEFPEFVIAYKGMLADHQANWIRT